MSRTGGGNRLVRVTPDGAVDLDVDISCPSPAFPRVGPAATGGFVTSCSAPDDTAQVIRRFDEDGTLEWTTTDAGAARVQQYAMRLLSDGDDQVWVLGLERNPLTISVQRYGPTGPLGTAYARIVIRRSDAVVDSASYRLSTLRQTAQGTLLLADERAPDPSDEGPGCCPDPPEGPVAPTLFLTRLPARPSCDVADPTVDAAEDTITGTFTTCVGGAPDQPRIGTTTHRVDASTDGSTVAHSASVAPGDEAPTGSFDLAADRGQAVTIVVTARNAAGNGTGRAGSTTLVPPFTTTAAFVARQHLDLTGTPPSPAAGTADVARIVARTATPTQLATDLLDVGLGATRVAPVARLYRSCFLRDADPTGLAHWIDRYAAGAKLGTISDRFAASSEFRTRDGALSNAAFVDQLYRNTFGRVGDAGGLAFWTKRLQTGRATRGSVVLQFSESSEFRRTSAPAIEPMAATWLLLERLPTTSERTAWQAAADPQATAVEAILGGDEDADRVG